MDISYYFKKAIEKKASDIHLVEGSIPSLRINGNLIKLGEKSIPFGELKYAIFSILTKEEKKKLQSEKDLDVNTYFYKNNFRINLHFQENHIGLTARLIPDKIPSPQEIGFENELNEFSKLKDGLILITGPSGAGKSTTMACLINLINKTRKAHIITIEDPIEYTFVDDQSIIEQRQLGRDTKSFNSALKHALRQDPNVIMVGEMRDAETMNAAITAASSGHLVISTLHTSVASETVERILDFFPSETQKEIAHQIASILRIVISQQLLPSLDNSLIAAREILINNDAIANLIRENKTEQIQSAIQIGSKLGMITMNKSIENLYKNKKISEETKNRRTRDLNTKIANY